MDISSGRFIFSAVAFSLMSCSASSTIYDSEARYHETYDLQVRTPHVGPPIDLQIPQTGQRLLTFPERVGVAYTSDAVRISRTSPESLAIQGPENTSTIEPLRVYLTNGKEYKFDVSSTSDSIEGHEQNATVRASVRPQYLEARTLLSDLKSGNSSLLEEKYGESIDAPYTPMFTTNSIRIISVGTYEHNNLTGHILEVQNLTGRTIPFHVSHIPLENVVLSSDIPEVLEPSLPRSTYTRNSKGFKASHPRFFVIAATG